MAKTNEELEDVDKKLIKILVDFMTMCKENCNHVQRAEITKWIKKLENL
jgi:hypothetical protein